MIFGIIPLYTLCLDAVSRLLMRCYRRPETLKDNPFRSYHSCVVHDLVGFICGKTTKEGFLRSSHLCYLLTSDRLTHLKIENVQIRLEDAEDIFQDLAPSSRRLKAIRIKDVTCVNSPWISTNFGNMLRNAEGLISIETSISFELSELSNCVNLEKLILNFQITDGLSSFLHVGNQIRYNHALRMLRILKPQTNRNLYLDIAKILQYCTEIIEIDYDVAQSLAYLHEKNRATRCKLQRALLGENESNIPFRATTEVIQLASLYCPDLRIVDVSPNDYSAINALSGFRRITGLTLNAPGELNDDDFRLGVRALLETPHIGNNLTDLVIKFFGDINFARLGVCCPNLEGLMVRCFSESNYTDFVTNSFQNLVSLHVENIMFKPSEAVSLIGVLSNAPGLEFLTIENASMFTDAVLDEILNVTNAFSNLKLLDVKFCGLSANGLRRLTQAMTSILYISYNSLSLSDEDILRVAKQMRLTCVFLICETPTRSEETDMGLEEV